jgi:hypothetical protein
VCVPDLSGGREPDGDLVASARGLYHQPAALVTESDGNAEQGFEVVALGSARRGPVGGLIGRAGAEVEDLLDDLSRDTVAAVCYRKIEALLGTAPADLNNRKPARGLGGIQGVIVKLLEGDMRKGIERLSSLSLQFRDREIFSGAGQSRMFALQREPEDFQGH